VIAAPGCAVDLSDGEAFRDGFPHEFFRWLREHDPVHRHEPTAKTPDGEAFWVVSRHEDVMAVLRDPATYSSDRAGGLRERGGTGLKDERSAGTMLNMTDEPQHHRLRSLVNRGFTPRAIASLEGELRRRTRVLLDPVGGEPFDAVQEFARELPAQAICIVLGIPEEDRRDLLDWLDAGIEADSASIVSADATRRIREYAAGLIAAKRTNTDGGIMSAIVHACLDDGGRLTDHELTAFFALLFPAGAETTRSAIAGGIKAFVEHPEQYARLRGDPRLLATAVEETVRWSTPSVYKRRTARRDVELRGRRIRAGDKVTVWEMSANHDESVFDSPFTFDVARHPNPHLGFGFGIHYCLGASLARLELRVALEELVQRFASLEAAGEHEWTPNNRLFGLKHYPVRGLPARSEATT
jgi:cytochrome P450